VRLEEKGKLTVVELFHSPETDPGRLIVEILTFQVFARVEPSVGKNPDGTARVKIVHPDGRTAQLRQSHATPV
jgi:hypothetical protein